MRRLVRAGLAIVAILGMAMGMGSASGATEDAGGGFTLMWEADPGSAFDTGRFTLVTYPTFDDLLNDTNRIDVHGVDNGIPVPGFTTTGIFQPGPDTTDSDGDGVPDDTDVCPGEDDTIDVDTDGIPDCNDPLIDSDGDGVADEEDRCAGTTLPDRTSREQKPNRYVATAGGFVDPDGEVVATLAETHGCSGSQIIDLLGLGAGHERFGITLSALEEWIDSLS